MSTRQPNAVPRRKRFNVSIEETFQTTFTVLAFTQDEADAMAEEMSEEQTYPPDARESCERSINVWKGRP